MILLIFGTRPEAIKLAPVAAELRERGAPHVVIHTGQHATLADGAIRQLGLRVDIRDDRPVHGHSDAFQRAMSVTQRWADHYGARCVIVQGDTATAAGAAVGAFYHGVPVAHVEAGLRTYVIEDPFPEEANRQIIARIARWHFCPTDTDEMNLEDERAGGVRYDVGNTVIDAIRMLGVETRPATGTRRVLVTMHRNQSAADFDDRAHALATATAAEGCAVTWIRHPGAASRGCHPPDADHITVIDPLDYRAMLDAVLDHDVVATDSGGLVEECARLERPVVLLRVDTERVWDGVYGDGINGKYLTTHDSLRAAFAHKTTDPEWGRDRFGDGYAARRIVDTLLSSLEAL